jgi:DNA-binding phage protein
MAAIAGMLPAQCLNHCLSSFDYLDSAKAIAAHLDAYLEDSTPEERRAALDTVARSSPPILPCPTK